jgi:hypothetical protein
MEYPGPVKTMLRKRNCFRQAEADRSGAAVPFDARRLRKVELDVCRHLAVDDRRCDHAMLGGEHAGEHRSQASVVHIAGLDTGIRSLKPSSDVFKLWIDGVLQTPVSGGIDQGKVTIKP